MYATFSGMDNSDKMIWYFSKIYLYIFISLFMYIVFSLFIHIMGDTYETISVSCLLLFTEFESASQMGK